MSSDSQALAGVKNRVGKWQLESQLQRIEQEAKAELRMHNTAKQRFKAKYYKPEHLVDKAQDVRMYETHNPGFCFRRNGECRAPPTSVPTPSVDYEDIYSLLFTEGEVDIEKVLCLHLLTAHKTETLSPPSKNNSHSFIIKNQTPVERLIERSRKKRQEDPISKILPTYIIDIITTKPGENPKKVNDIVIRDGRLAARIIINDKIVQLIRIVLDALQHTNPAKMNTLLEMASDVEVIKEVIKKSHVIDFLGTLNGHTLICSCESFHLTQPFKAVTIPLELEITTNNIFAKLLYHIRKTVLQPPALVAIKPTEKSDAIGEDSKSEIRVASKSGIKPDDTTSEISRSTTSPSERSDVRPSSPNSLSSSIKKVTVRNRDPNTNARAGFRSGNSKEPKISVHPSFLSFLDDDKSKKSTFSSKSDKVKNMKKQSTLGATDLNMIDDDPNFFKNLDIRHVANLINEDAIDAQKKDQKQKMDIHKYDHVHDHPQTSAKLSVKQMNCHACMNRWKIPLPIPKTSNIKKASISAIEHDDEFSTGSAQKLSLMIDEEISKLNAERRRTPNTPYMPRDFKNKAIIPQQAVDTVEMDALDLAKITQQIKEKETQKKLMQFLSDKG